MSPPRRWSLRPIDASELDWAFELQVAAMGDYIAASRGWDGETQSSDLRRAHRR